MKNRAVGTGERDEMILVSEVVGLKNWAVGTGERDEMISVSEVVGVKNGAIGAGERDEMVSVLEVLWTLEEELEKIWIRRRRGCNLNN